MIIISQHPSLTSFFREKREEHLFFEGSTVINGTYETLPIYPRFSFSANPSIILPLRIEVVFKCYLPIKDKYLLQISERLFVNCNEEDGLERAIKCFRSLCETKKETIDIKKIVANKL